MTTLATGADKDRVDTPCLAYRDMAERWPMLHDLLGGTAAMREAGTKWLPMAGKENKLAWRARRDRSFLYNAYRDAVQRLVSKPFSRPVTIQGELPERLQPMLENMDGAGRNITQFAKDVMRAGVVYGVTELIVDYPQLTGEETRAQERAIGARPVAIHIQPPQLLGWRVEDQPGGARRIVELRIKEEHIQPDGEYGEKTVNWVRILREGGWELHEQTSEYEYVRTGAGVHTYRDEDGNPAVPLVVYYTNRGGLLTGVPPLEDLAWLNVAHWQSASDQRWQLYFMRTGVWFIAGMDEEEKSQPLVIGGNQAVIVKDPAAKMTVVESSGQAAGIGRQELLDLEEQMVTMGLQPFVRRSGDATATERAIDEARAVTDIQAWIRSLEGALREVFAIAARWVGEELPDDFAVDIFNEFSLTEKGAEDIRNLLALRQAREISRITFYRELKRRGLLSETVEPEKEAEAIALEGPSLGMIGDRAQEDEDDEEEDDAEG